jgi:hypothetical protein
MAKDYVNTYRKLSMKRTNREPQTTRPRPYLVSRVKT